MISLDECTPFLRDIDTDIRLVSLLVGDSHSGNAIANSDVQSTMTVEALHTASNPLVLLGCDCLLVLVICGSSGLTTMVCELFV